MLFSPAASTVEEKENCSPATVTLPSSKTGLVTDTVKEAFGRAGCLNFFVTILNFAIPSKWNP